MPPKRRFIHNILFLVIILSTAFVTAFYSYFLLPNEQHLIVGDTIDFPSLVPQELLKNVSVHVKTDKIGVLEINGSPVNEKGYRYMGTPAVAAEPGKLNLELKVFGVIPLKSMMVDVLPEIQVIPGGHSVGVILQTEGVMVVGHSAVYGKDGETLFPAKDAGIELGDLLVSINDDKIKNDKHAAELINKYGPGGILRVEVKRSGKAQEMKVVPHFCEDTKTYRIGLYIRDNAAGVGTLTFYEPNEGKYGALGHMITDLDIRPGEKGKIVKAQIQGIKPGKKGEPGEKIAMFVGDALKGDIDHNSNFGIFGKLDNPINNSFYKTGISVAFANQIQEGPAEIITVIQGDKLEKFDINILKVLPQHHPTGKGLVIQVTDPRLLKETGGIIQGMSGSPIVQNSKLVGAVTHVFVNDPTKGYGCLAEWMLLEAGLIKKHAFLAPEIQSKSPISLKIVS
ncbi:MAG: SpoIVB peptidase [Desulfitobacteriaceae bacterium]|nr:SpoIVB peptidase [Desulfitobacteriaceae bacterium]